MVSIYADLCLECLKVVDCYVWNLFLPRSIMRPLTLLFGLSSYGGLGTDGKKICKSIFHQKQGDLLGS